MENIRKTEKGFTLIELLVVVAIIGLLSAVAFASLRDARDKAALAKFKQDFTQVRNAFYLYMNEHNGNLPVPIDPNNWPTMDQLVTALNTAGLYKAKSWDFPEELFGEGSDSIIVPGGKLGDLAGCDYSNYNDFFAVYFFDVPAKYANEFGTLYYGEEFFYQYGCLTF